MNWIDRILILITLGTFTLLAMVYMAIFSPHGVMNKEMNILKRAINIKRMVNDLQDHNGRIKMKTALAIEQESNNIIREIRYT